ncbi:MAG: enoyl-CoA hydratase/isomerase family protein [Pseudomonadales bacterium]|nr:enoyl-CoA hydratase/isomerase family protein [Pseudomonadales bacterium]
MSDVVLFEKLPLGQDALNESKFIGQVTLNVESTLNSLSLQMIELLTEQLTKWREDDSILALFFQGAGSKAFCAGGDIQALYHAMVGQPGEPVPYAESFFEQEYRLDYLIHTYPKPTIAWAHGIVMGGGLGIMGACDYRIGTQRTRIALPEITIGLFPDAGASWFFSKMELHWAHFLAWTGCSINARDAQLVGLVNHLLQHDQKDEFVRELQSADWFAEFEGIDGQGVIADVILKLEAPSAGFPPSKLLEHENLIEGMMSDCLANENPVAAFVKALPKLEGDTWLEKAASSFSRGTPTTAQIIERQFRLTRNISLKEMLKIELIIAVQCARHPDFTEGVRALLIEKDNKPLWQYNEMGKVPESWIDEHFSAPWDRHPLDDLPELG